MSGRPRWARIVVLVTTMVMVSISSASRHISFGAGDAGRRAHREKGEFGEGSIEGDAGSYASSPTCLHSSGFALRKPWCPDVPLTTTGSSPASFRFSRVLVGVGGDVEASITLGPDRSMLVCSHGGFEGPSTIWASLDLGRTWRRTEPRPNPIVSGDCDMTVMDDGTWAIVYDTIASSTVASSRDRGKTWSLAHLSALPLGGVDRPWLVPVGKRLLMAYANVQANEPALHVVTFSDDHGKTWPEHRVINTFELPERPNGVMGRPIVRGNTIRIPIAMTNVLLGGRTWLYMLTSRDAGRSWVRGLVHGPYSTGVHFTTLTEARTGKLYMGLPTGAIGDLDVSVLVSQDDGRSWERIVLARHVSLAGAPVSSVAVDARPDGTATVAWLSEVPTGRQVWAARVGSNGVLVRPQAISEPVKDSSPFEFVMVEHDTRGRAHVVAPLDTGPNCHAPSVTGGRLRQCVYDFIER